ncbi:splicing regulator SDE2 [Neoarius graeffei]|uniref:splicing regulator SDE2 n=1 Tax=Neoarius graeffei TaxID=443677 RepID=UPI00298D2080|nr:splicing regulator SDE2 [Neoarius graeffei]
MEIFVVSPFLRFINVAVPHESTVSDLIGLLNPGEGISCVDFYVKKNGRISGGDERLQAGAVYRLEPRLCGGKGGFGSMLRALGAQIEKTTNREACRDLSGRRLRDVNHEKEMAEWLKKQADRDADKEQRRLERIRRKLAEPKHELNFAEYEQECEERSKMMEAAVRQGLQASKVQADEKPHRKRPATEYGNAPSKKKHLWLGIEKLREQLGSDEDSDESEAEASSSSSSSSGAGPSCSSQSTTVPTTATREQEKAESRDQSSSFSAGSVPCSPSPSQEEVEETEEHGRLEPNEKEENKQNVSDQQETEKEGTVEVKDCTETQPEEADTAFDLLSVSSVEELEALGLERLKAELTKRGLKCGGTLQERAARLYSVRGLSVDQINPALFPKPSKCKKKK